MRVATAIKMAALVALFSAVVFAQDLPKIAVYVTGDVSDSEKKALGTKMLSELINSGRYIGIERSTAFLAEIDKEQERQRSGAIDDKQISQLGRQFGVTCVCIADITPALGAFQISARIVDVETAQVSFIGESNSALESLDDLAKVSIQVVKKMFGEWTEEPKPEPAAPPPQPPQPQYTQETSPQAQPPAASQSAPPIPKRRTFDFYFAPKFVSVPSPYIMTGVNVETGLIWGKGTFLGFDFGFGFDLAPLSVADDGGPGLFPYAYYGDAVPFSDQICDQAMWVGGGLSFGFANDFGGGLQLAYGGSIGIWIIEEVKKSKMIEANRYGAVYERKSAEGGRLGGPFVKLRWRFVELTYRGLLGFAENMTDRGTDGTYTYRSYDYYDTPEEKSTAFAYTHQLMIGFHLVTSRRTR